MFRKQPAAAGAVGGGTGSAGVNALDPRSPRLRPSEWVDRRGFSGNATLRWVVRGLIITNLFSVVALVFVIKKFYDYALQTWEQPAIVFRVTPDGNTTKHSISEFRDGPFPEEVRGRAWDLARFYLGAGTRDYATKFAEARRMMSPDLQEEFDRSKNERIAELTATPIYRKIEGGKVRKLEEGDLPAELQGKVKINEYDYVVAGRLDTYREGETEAEPVIRKEFALWVRQKPLGTRTEENMQGLEVTGMMLLDAKPRSAAPGASKATPTPTPGADESAEGKGAEKGAAKQ